MVTDGVRYDTGPDGAFFHALVTYVREADKAGNIIMYRQEADGQLIKTGVIEKVDPQASKKRRFTYISPVCSMYVLVLRQQQCASDCICRYAEPPWQQLYLKSPEVVREWGAGKKDSAAAKGRRNARNAP